MKKHVAPTLIFALIMVLALVGLHLGYKNYVVLGSIMLFQNMTFTMASRARNSESLSYVAIAQLLANGTFILALGRMGERISTWQMQIFYCVMTTAGGTLMVYLSAKYIEKGARRVGGSLADRVDEIERSLKAKSHTPVADRLNDTLYAIGLLSPEDEKRHLADVSGFVVPFPDAVHRATDSRDFECMEAANDAARTAFCCECKHLQNCLLRVPEHPSCTGFEKGSVG